MFAVSSSAGDRVYVIGSDGSGLTEIAPGKGACCPLLSPDARRIAVGVPSSKNGHTTATMTSNGSSYRVFPLPDKTLNLLPAAWSPDGRRLAFEGWDPTNRSRVGIFTASATDGSHLVQLTKSPDGRHDVPVEYSPDGSRVLFFHVVSRKGYPADDPTPGDLFVVNADGSGRIRLNPPGTVVTEDPGSWSPDGRTVTFAALLPGAPDHSKSAVFEVDPDASHLHRITPWGAWSTYSRWSPDGHWIVFDKVNSPGGAHSLFLVHPDGTGLMAITDPSAGGVCCAVWSPDRAWLLFPFNGLAVVSVDGTQLGELLNNPADYYGYAWGPSKGV